MPNKSHVPNQLESGEKRFTCSLLVCWQESRMRNRRRRRCGQPQSLHKPACKWAAVQLPACRLPLHRPSPLPPTSASWPARMAMQLLQDQHPLCICLLPRGKTRSSHKAPGCGVAVPGRWLIAVEISLGLEAQTLTAAAAFPTGSSGTSRQEILASLPVLQHDSRTPPMGHQEGDQVQKLGESTTWDTSSKTC